MRLIDAYALSGIAFQIKQYGKGVRCVVDLNDVDDIPTVDAVEVVHGRWVMTLYTTTSKRGRVIANKKFACSVCGYGNGRKQSNHCPNCGAKMDGDGNGDS